MGEPIFYDLPNGMRSVAGGTRGEIKLSRPWQKEIEVNPATCPFCTGKGEVKKELANGEWLLLKNKFTPYPFHEMVIPATCWSSEKLRALGGRAEIARVLYYAKEEIEKYGKGKKLFVTVHIGALAGQNVGHLHYHIVEYMPGSIDASPVAPFMRAFFETHPKSVLFRTGIFMVGIGGVKAGQCVIVYERNRRMVDTGHLASSIASIVSLYNDKFMSSEGLPPDFSLALQFLNGEFQYGGYTPILNHWGAAEQMVLYEHGWPRHAPVAA